MQLEKDSHYQFMALAKKFKEKGSDVFQLSKVVPPDSKAKEEAPKKEAKGAKATQPIKDIQEYEYFQNQKQHFYSGYLADDSRIEEP